VRFHIYQNSANRTQLVIKSALLLILNLLKLSKEIYANNAIVFKEDTDMLSNDLIQRFQAFFQLRHNMKKKIDIMTNFIPEAMV
jgi:hypothetical protein